MTLLRPGDLGQANRYTYVSNNPLSNVDPPGLNILGTAGDLIGLKGCKVAAGDASERRTVSGLGLDPDAAGADGASAGDVIGCGASLSGLGKLGKSAYKGYTYLAGPAD